MFKSIGCSRFAYNWGINKVQEYKERGKKYSMNEIRKEFTQLKKQEEFKWLNEVSSKVTQESLRNLDKTFKQFFKTKKGYPKFKSKKKSKQSFYVRAENLYFLENGTCNIEKIGKVKYRTNYKLPFGRNICKFSKRGCLPSIIAVIISGDR